MKKFMMILIFIVLLFTINGYCANVTDNNKGNKGQILINNGTGQGHQGTWSDTSTLGFANSDDLKVEIDKRTSADKDLQTNIDNEAVSRIKLGDDLTTSINSESTQRISADSRLQTNINSESSIRSNADNQLQNNINQVNSRVDNLDHRVGKLEQTQYKLQAEFRIVDTKRMSIAPYVSQNFTRSCIDEVGVRVTFKLGKSYEEREIEKTNKRLDNLEAFVGTPEVQEAIEQVKMKNIKVNTDGRNFWIERKF